MTRPFVLALTMSPHPTKPHASSDPGDVLFTVAPANFVEERNRLAAELKRAGKGDEAAAVKKMQKPSVSVFALNQAARRAPAAVKALVAATDALRKTQAAGGAGGRQAYQEALHAQREPIDELVEEARAALEEAEVKVTPAVLERVANDLRWGALSPEARSLLETGRLLEDLEPPGFEALAGEVVRAPSSKHEKPSARGASRALGESPAPANDTRLTEREEKRRREREAHEERERLQGALAKAKTRVSDAARREKTAELRGRRADGHVVALKAELEKAEGEADAARTELQAASSAHAEAEAEVTKLERELRSLRDGKSFGK